MKKPATTYTLRGDYRPDELDKLFRGVRVVSPRRFDPKKARSGIAYKVDRESLTPDRTLRLRAKGKLILA